MVTGNETGFCTYWHIEIVFYMNQCPVSVVSTFTTLDLFGKKNQKHLVMLYASYEWMPKSGLALVSFQIMVGIIILYDKF